MERKIMKPGEVLEMYVIYAKPLDYPQSFVVRKWEVGGKPSPRNTEWFGLGATVEEVRGMIPGWCVKIDRDPNDEPQIVETWL
jgi:hypothetical protein